MISHSIDDQRGAHAALLEAAHSGELPMTRIDEAVGRVLAAKRRAFALPQPGLEVIGCTDHTAIRAAITGGGEAEAAWSVLGAEKPSRG